MANNHCADCIYYQPTETYLGICEAKEFYFKEMGYKQRMQLACKKHFKPKLKRDSMIELLEVLRGDYEESEYEFALMQALHELKK